MPIVTIAFDYQIRGWDEKIKSKNSELILFVKLDFQTRKNFGYGSLYRSWPSPIEVAFSGAEIGTASYTGEFYFEGLSTLFASKDWLYFLHTFIMTLLGTISFVNYFPMTLESFSARRTNIEMSTIGSGSRVTFSRAIFGSISIASLGV